MRRFENQESHAEFINLKSDIPFPEEMYYNYNKKYGPMQ